MYVCMLHISSGERCFIAYGLLSGIGYQMYCLVQVSDIYGVV